MTLTLGQDVFFKFSRKEKLHNYPGLFFFLISNLFFQSFCFDIETFIKHASNYKQLFCQATHSISNLRKPVMCQAGQSSFIAYFYILVQICISMDTEQAMLYSVCYLSEIIILTSNNVLNANDFRINEH
jgi:hypothetical protein